MSRIIGHALNRKRLFDLVHGNNVQAKSVASQCARIVVKDIRFRGH